MRSWIKSWVSPLILELEINKIHFWHLWISPNNFHILDFQKNQYFKSIWQGFINRNFMGLCLNHLIYGLSFCRSRDQALWHQEFINNFRPTKSLEPTYIHNFDHVILSMVWQLWEPTKGNLCSCLEAMKFTSTWESALFVFQLWMSLTFWVELLVN